MTLKCSLEETVATTLQTLPVRHMFAIDIPAQRMNTSLPSFQLNIYCGATLVDTFITDCREDFDEVIAFAQAVKERGRQERKPATIEDLPGLKREIISVLMSSLREEELKCMPRAFVSIETCNMDML